MEESSDFLEKTRKAKVLSEIDLLHLQESQAKEKEYLYDKVFKQLIKDHLARDKQNQNEGYVLGQAKAHLSWVSNPSTPRLVQAINMMDLPISFWWVTCC